MLFGRHIQIKLAKNAQESPKEEKDMKKLEDVKKHFKTNKTAYISAGTAAAGLTAGLLLSGGNQKVIVDSFNFALLKWHSPTTNIVTTELVRRGHPGFLIKCLETGETFASKTRACDVMNVNHAELNKHLNGAIEAVKGLHFENLGEAI